MTILLFLLSLSFCRYVNLNPGQVLTFKDRIEQDTMYKFIYRAFGQQSVNIALYDPKNRKITESNDIYGVLYTRSSSKGLLTVSVTNTSNEPLKFGYKCPDVDKELQGPLGPIKDVDAVGELQSVLENIIKTQREHINRYKKHAEMLDNSRKWVFKLVLFEIVSSLVMMYFLHRSTLELFNTKKVTQ